VLGEVYRGAVKIDEATPFVGDGPSPICHPADGEQRQGCAEKRCLAYLSLNFPENRRPVTRTPQSTSGRLGIALGYRVDRASVEEA
jgi:hypothetical protein